MIVKTNQGHVVKSEGGKNLSAPDLSLEQAKKRLQQIEFFKRQGKMGKFVHAHASRS